MEDRHTSRGSTASAQAPQLGAQEASIQQQQQQQRPAGRRLSSNSSTGSFTAISMEDESLLGAKQEAEAAAVLSRTPPQHPHQLRFSALHDSPLQASDDEQQLRSRAQEAWGKASSYSNPAYVADFTALPPPLPAPNDVALPTPPARTLTAAPSAPPATEPAVSKSFSNRRSPSSDALAPRAREEAAPAGYYPLPMAASVGSVLAHGEDLPVDRCFVVCVHYGWQAALAG